ncbi:hypothetical protein HanXRQr2_Chr04g0141621 [Helianthus annuus]|uniref:Uncharacterized protein n=1 Tax=Helianthus annuus TaxID=4232 RepID=A0A9K3NPP4_HELAN|nr:hypothetical protein HanXRQr2_Chr04g0141621 [Helianthus annuus]
MCPQIQIIARTWSNSYLRWYHILRNHKEWGREDQTGPRVRL